MYDLDLVFISLIVHDCVVMSSTRLDQAFDW
jgi:hypothetical protein